jgi:ribonuclease G
MNRIIADVGFYETRAAVMEDERLLELHFERKFQKSLVNNIYLGKVTNVLYGLQTVFLNIGQDKNAFLYKDQLSIPIENVNPGDSLLIQVTKDAIGDKGPKATMNLSLPGKYLVLMPHTDHLGISTKIKDSEERQRLTAWAADLSREGDGIIIRTEAAGQKLQALDKDWGYLQARWKQILERKDQQQTGMPIYQEDALLPRLLRDVTSQKTEFFMVNDEAEAESLREICRVSMPHLLPKIQEIPSDINPFTEFDVEGQWQRAMNREIPLACGGSLVINHTEALTTIDVNTGRYRGATGFQNAALTVNLEAADEIARQLRLRDIGGIIIIDFIDMKDPAAKNRLISELKRSLVSDRQKTVVVGMTRLGLVEMTRKKTRKKVEALFNDSCHCCSGSGLNRSTYWTLYQIETKLRRLEKNPDSRFLLLRLHPAREKQLMEAGIDLKELARRYGMDLMIKHGYELKIDEHELTSASDRSYLSQPPDE